MAGKTTICLQGFPLEAQVRELKNFCRFLQGFEGAHVAFGGPHGTVTALFVKFESSDLAGAAIDQLTGLPFDLDNPTMTLRAEMARREMEVRASAGPSAPARQPAPAVSTRRPEPHRRGPATPLPSRHRAPAVPAMHVPMPLPARTGTGEELMTLTVVKVREKNLDPRELEQWFQDQPGYLTHHMNSRVDTLFVRFNSGRAADQALREASHFNYGAEWARRNLDDDRGGGPPPAAPPSSVRIGNTGGELVTIAILRLHEKGLSGEELHTWFEQMPGFVAAQLNDRIGGIFVKFDSVHAAEQALAEANDNKYGAEWARRNLDDDLSARHHGHSAPISNGGGRPGSLPAAKRHREASQDSQLDTVAVVGMHEKGLDPEHLQAFFQEQPGFVALQLHDRIGSVFVKFSSHEAAESVLQVPEAEKYGAEWARRNLDI